MKLTVLGFWGAYPYKNSGTTSFLIEADGFSLLLDAGSQTFLKLTEQLDPLDLDAVLISHYHHDHVADLGVLQYYRQLKKHDKPVPTLPIYGHTEDKCAFVSLNHLDVTKGKAYHEEDKLAIGPFDVTFLRTIHPVTCFAIRLEERKSGKVLVFSGDSGYLESFIPFIKGADLFLADTYFLNGNENNGVHLTAGEAGKLADKGQVKELVLTHLPQEIDLSLLLKQAEATAGKIPVKLASQNLELII